MHFAYGSKRIFIPHAQTQIYYIILKFHIISKSGLLEKQRKEKKSVKAKRQRIVEDVSKRRTRFVSGVTTRAVSERREAALSKAARGSWHFEQQRLPIYMELQARC